MKQTLTIKDICNRWRFDMRFVQTVIRDCAKFPRPVRGNKYKVQDVLRFECAVPWVRPRK